MIITKTLKIKVNPNSRIHFNSKGYKCDNFDIIVVNVCDLPSGSTFVIKAKCDICSDVKDIVYNRYYKMTNNNINLYYCKKCSYIKMKKTKLERYGDENYQNTEKAKKTKLERYGDENYQNTEKAKKTCMERYGVDNISKLENIKEMKKNIFIEKYGVDNPFKSDEIKNKIKNTINEKYGVDFYIQSDDAKDKYSKFCESLNVDHYSKSDEFKSKFEKTCIDRWGFKTNLLNPVIKDRIKLTNLEKYGFDHVMKNKDISLMNTKTLIDGRNYFFLERGYEFISYDYDNQIYNLKSMNCGHTFDINYDLFRSRIKYKNSSCLVCFPKDELTSIKEKEICKWLIGIGVKIITNSRNIINRELDIYLPEYNLAIEFNGLYWHSDKFKEKNYHNDKTNECNKIGIDLIHIWEDDWMYKKDIMKSIILNKLKKNYHKIYARNCNIIKLSNSESRTFLDKNHIQGYSNSSISIGLTFNEKIVSVMTFGKRRLNNKNTFELIRFCNLINTNVIGSATKLFKFFEKNYEFNEIISYSDRATFSGNIYELLSFKQSGFTQLNYYWTDLNKKYHRFNFNKKKLIKMGYDTKLTEEDIMKNIGYYKIWSCGQIKWIYNKK